jgi:hypothetical protein
MQPIFANKFITYKMATLNSLSVTTSTGETFLLQLTAVVNFYDKASKAVLTFMQNENTQKTVTLTISSATLRTNLNTTYLNSVTFVNPNGTTKLLYINMRRIVVVTSSAKYTGVNAAITYYDGFSSPTTQYYVTDIASTVAALYARIFAVNQNVTATVFYINADYVTNVVNNPQGSQLTLTSATLAGAGTAWIPTETFDFAGGTEIADAKGVVNTTRLVTGTVTAAGTGADPTLLLRVGGGAGASVGKMSFSSKVVTKPAVASAGNGYNVGDTFKFNDGTGVNVVFTVATLTGGAGTGIATYNITSAGAFTVNPTLGATRATTTLTGGGSGAQLNVILADFGVNAIISVTTGGSYTTNPILVNNAVTLGATGATVTIVMGINTFSITDGGSYSVKPTNPISEDNASGTGTGATFTGKFASGGSTIFVNDTIGTEAKQYNVEQTPVEIEALIA